MERYGIRVEFETPADALEDFVGDALDEGQDVDDIVQAIADELADEDSYK